MDSSTPLQAHLNAVAKGVTNEVEGDDCQHDRDTSRVDLPPVTVVEEVGLNAIEKSDIN
jgi:hypothetical protein